MFINVVSQIEIYFTLLHRASTQLVGVRAPGTGNKQGWLKGYVNTNLNTGTYRGGRSLRLEIMQASINKLSRMAFAPFHRHYGDRL